ncbi:beta-ketoacyl-[acyl-carrier-protein] synthase family protein [Pseudomarimonas arenosa]|uniref:Beta-ketoacyl-[acyl-carrier-protein] synthase family protein n=1 Tax=Pseudomarimonas arenosa TaxID=2774145 RepID=A0AAW3ZLX7_9GAMM|nr:beta-ketoacyl-[acyl-carrier-protein] synthase family protein [Pseudomarimonas arenosa]MBD8525416.1 beta-ketoacyl-[acyl-carrier-protein] synthase family protein [Pseudomarimonas arenosa]
MSPLAVIAATATTACGPGLAALRQALQDQRTGLRQNDFGDQPLVTHIGRVDGLEEAALPADWSQWDCRNNRLAWLALQQDTVLQAVQQAIERFGAARVALVIGTSTSSIGASEEAYRRLQADGQFPSDLQRPIVHTPHSLGDFLRHATAIRGPAVTVATACSSSAKVFAQAARMIEAGLVDAALVGGVDTLCGSVLFGFNSLGLVSQQPCRPFDRQRDGLSLGEAGGFALLQRTEPDEHAGPWLLGYGESSDAHHMSSPHPEGLGARLSMQAALDRAGLPAELLDYLNLHGTATPKNDEIEAAAVAALFPARLRASSTKGFTGHTLGAAGIVESIIALSALETGLMPATLNCIQPDPTCSQQLLLANQSGSVRYAMNNSFGFGGNNCSLLFGAGATP